MHMSDPCRAFAPHTVYLCSVCLLRVQRTWCVQRPLLQQVPCEPNLSQVGYICEAQALLR